MDELLDLVVEQFLEAHACVLDAVHEIGWPLAEHLQAFFKSDDVLLGDRVDFFTFFKDFDETLRLLREHFSEFVTGPLNAMEGLLWEHLESAMWDLVFFHRVLLGSIGLSLEGQDDLNVTFGAERAAFKQGRLCRDASNVNILPGLHIVQSVCHQSQLLEELVREDVARTFMDLVQSSDYVALEIWIHVDGGGCGSLGLGFA